MANWCYNIISVSGEAEIIKEFINEIESLRKLSIELERGVLPSYVEAKSQTLDGLGKYDRYFFDIQIDHDIHSFRCETKWCPPIDELAAISAKYPSLSFEMEYEELGCLIYGKCFIKNSEIKDVFLEEAELSRVTYDDEGNCLFDREYCESEQDVLNNLLTDKINKQNG